MIRETICHALVDHLRLFTELSANTGFIWKAGVYDLAASRWIVAPESADSLDDAKSKAQKFPEAILGGEVSPS